MSVSETTSIPAYRDCLSGAWLSTSLGIDAARIDAMRRAGELIAVRPPGSTHWLYPAWQFHNGQPRHVVPRIVAAARESGLDEARLFDVMTARRGLARAGDDRSLAELLVAGNDDIVVDAVRRSAPRP